MQYFWHYDFENMGKSPAHNVVLLWDIFRADVKLVAAGRAGVAAIIEKAKSWPHTGETRILFPGETTQFIREHGWTGIGMGYSGTGPNLHLCTCIKYALDPLGKEWGYEARIFPIERSDQVGPLGFKLLEIPAYAIRE